MLARTSRARLSSTLRDFGNADKRTRLVPAMDSKANADGTWLSRTNSRRGENPESGGETVRTELFWFVSNMMDDDEGAFLVVVAALAMSSRGPINFADVKHVLGFRP